MVLVTLVSSIKREEEDVVTYVPERMRLVLAKHDDNEVLGGPDRNVRLVTDGSAAGGALSTIRVKLGGGDLGATPHQHRRCTEMFYVLSGAVAVMAGDEIVEGYEGDQLIVSPNVPHAFAATSGPGCEVLVVLTPGLDRFDYFRTLIRVQTGELPPGELLAVAARTDTYFEQSPLWDAHVEALSTAR
jgi:mannose-6-phosphate isomerase-like protein (cupin superfamily)